MRDLLVSHCTRFFSPFPLITSPPAIAFSFSCAILASEMRYSEVVSKKVCNHNFPAYMTKVCVFLLLNAKIRIMVSLHFFFRHYLLKVLFTSSIRVNKLF